MRQRHSGERRGGDARWLNRDEAPTRIAIVDARRFIAEALAALIDTMEGFVVSGVLSTESAGSTTDDVDADVILIGVMAGAPMPLELVRSLRERTTAVEIVLLVDTATPELVQFVLDAHLSGLLLNDLSSDDITVCLDQVARGRAVLPHDWQSVLAERPEDPLRPLSGRQVEVLELLADGCSYDEIATRLFISVNTVKFHIRSIFARLGIHSRVEAAQLLATHAGHPAGEGPA